MEILFILFLAPFAIVAGCLVLTVFVELVGATGDFVNEVIGPPRQQPKKPWPKTMGTVMWVGALLLTLGVMLHQVKYLLH